MLEAMGSAVHNTATTAANKVGGMKFLGNGLVGDAFNVFGAVSVYNDARERGDSTGMAVLKAGGDFVASELILGGMQKALLARGVGTIGQLSIPMAVMMGASALPNLFVESSKHTTQAMNEGYRHAGGFGSGHFNMNEYGYTMRQRSLNAIQQNGLNTQSVLGNEARNYSLA